MKVSAVAPERHVIEAPAAIFHDQASVKEAFRAGRSQPRRHRRRPLPGPARQRHAGVARADADPRRVAGPGPQGGARHRWPHVGRLRQGPLGDPCRARGARWRADRQAARTAIVIRVDATTGTLSVLTEGVGRPSRRRPRSRRQWLGRRARALRGLPRPRRTGHHRRGRRFSDTPDATRPDPLHLSPNTHAEGDRAAEVPCGRAARPPTRGPPHDTPADNPASPATSPILRRSSR
jgi:hypothetical protein